MFYLALELRNKNEIHNWPKDFPKDSYPVGKYWDMLTLPGQNLNYKLKVRTNCRAYKILTHHPDCVALVLYSHEVSKSFLVGNSFLVTDHAWEIYLTTKQFAQRLIMNGCLGYREDDTRMLSSFLRPPSGLISDESNIFSLDKTDSYIDALLSKDEIPFTPPTSADYIRVANQQKALESSGPGCLKRCFAYSMKWDAIVKKLIDTKKLIEFF